MFCIELLRGLVSCRNYLPAMVSLAILTVGV